MNNIDELLKIIEDAKAKTVEVRPSKKGQVQVDKFISDLKLQRGSDKIPTYVIFYHYRVKWDGINRSNKLNKIVFFRIFSKLFNPYRIGKQRYYLLDKSSFDISREGLQEAKYYEERFFGEARKKIKETKKKLGKISKLEKKLKPKI